jgi:hypothetical protein
MNSPPQLPGHFRFAEPELTFHPDRPQDRGPHPLRGLLEFGPYSRSLLNPVLDPIRVATLSPHGESGRLRRFIKSFEHPHAPRERKNYLPDWPGFSNVFGLRLLPAEIDRAHVELPADLDHRIKTAVKPHVVLAEALTTALRAFSAAGPDYDVLMIMLPDRWAAGFEGGRDESFDLHDFLKAHLAIKALPSQLVQEAGALSYFCSASVAWRLGIALYCKAGGVPWKLADPEPETAYIGLSYAVRPKAQDGRRFLTCCSQVFDADGAGLEFIAYETADYRVFGENPFLSRTEMRRVMSRSLALYQARHAGRVPRHLFVHKTTEFKPREVEGAFDALGHIATVDLVQIKEEAGWKGVRIDPPKPGSHRGGTPARYPLERGTLLPLGGEEALLWTAGNAPEAAGGKSFFKEGKGIPDPVMLVRHAGHGGWESTAGAVLGLSKMNWNNDSLYDRMPVTLGFASALARTVVNMSQLGSRPYPVRYFI